MRVYFCIDDTDVVGSPGTGHLSQEIREGIEQRNWASCSAVSRHQLFVHPDVPYTSHNSAMCFEMETRDDDLDKIINFGTEMLLEKSMDGSDPGLCVAAADEIPDKDKLEKFGSDAKKRLCTKTEAYALAKELGVHLSEHGGTGGGVIGALAGTGLRISGNDGRFRGWHFKGKKGERSTVKELLSHDFVDLVRSGTGEILADDTIIQFGDDRVKTVMQDHQRVIIVSPNGQNNGHGNCRFETLTRQMAKQY